MGSGARTLLVCTTDQVASDLLALLRTRRVAVPDAVSVVTLENSAKFLFQGITASAIDYDLVGYLMAHALIGDIPLRKSSRGFLSIDSGVIERLT